MSKIIKFFKCWIYYYIFILWWNDDTILTACAVHTIKFIFVAHCTNMQICHYILKPSPLLLMACPTITSSRRPAAPHTQVRYMDNLGFITLVVNIYWNKQNNITTIWIRVRNSWIYLLGSGSASGSIMTFLGYWIRIPDPHENFCESETLLSVNILPWRLGRCRWGSRGTRPGWGRCWYRGKCWGRPVPYILLWPI